MEKQQKNITEKIKEICKNTDSLLWNSYHRAKGKDVIIDKKSRQEFPIYRGTNNRVRVSEQEARFAFVEAILIYDSPYKFSVETPTTKKYRFSGKKSSRSAQTDLTLYIKNREKIINIEFKAQGASINAKNKERIEKDIQKLLREPCDGLWFHVVRNINRKTISNLIEVFEKNIRSVYIKYKKDINSKQLVFHICCLEDKFSLQKVIKIDTSNFEKEIISFSNSEIWERSEFK